MLLAYPPSNFLRRCYIHSYFAPHPRRLGRSRLRFDRVKLLGLLLYVGRPLTAVAKDDADRIGRTAKAPDRVLLLLVSKADAVAVIVQPTGPIGSLGMSHIGGFLKPLDRDRAVLRNGHVKFIHAP